MRRAHGAQRRGNHDHGTQNYSGPVTLGADATLAGAGVTFSSTVQSPTTAVYLRERFGTSTFSAAVGGGRQSAGLGDQNAAGNDRDQWRGGDDFGHQTYNDNVTLGGHDPDGIPHNFLMADRGTRTSSE